MTKYLLPFFLVLIVFVGCKDDDDIVTPVDDGDLTDIPYDPQDYELVVPCNFPEMEIPEDNPLTVDGIELGRFLFYDPILSADSTQSCSSCHSPQGNFTDNLAVSTGIDGIAGRRSSMPLLNIGFVYTGLFWDGRAATLEEQALMPVEDPIEMHHTWPELVGQLKAHSTYPAMFRKAFGIENKSEITKELAAKAIAQFERTMVSSGQAKFDQVLCEPGVFFTPDEEEGRILFSNELGQHPGCTHCHSISNFLFTDNDYHNNGIDSVGTSVEDLNNFADYGLGEVTNNVFDNGKFRTPSLRNITLSAPYMHDGRFETLEEVIQHYSTGGFSAANSNSNQTGFPITDEEVQQIIAFLKTLEDPAFVNNPAFQNPFD